MKPTPAITVLIALPIALFAAGLPAMAGEFFVAPNGKDSHPGSAEKPFATLERAREAARQDKGPTTITLKSGTYRMDATFALDERDDHTTYRALPGTDARICGAKAIPASAVKPVTDPKVLERLLPEVRGKVLEADLAALGVKDFGDVGPRGFRRPYVPAPLELIVDDKAMDLARWPNVGEEGIRLGKVFDGGPVTRKFAKPTRGGTFALTTDRPKRWTQAKDVWITGLFNNGYADNTVKVKEIDLEQNRMVTVHPHMYGFTSRHAWNRWVALNLLEEIDMPGEFMADKDSGKLYFLLPEGKKITDCALEVTLLKEPLIAMEGATKVVFDGLTLENTRGMGVYIERGAGCRIQNSTLRNMGMLAVCIGKGIAPDTLYRPYFIGTPISRELGSWHEHIYLDTVFDREGGKNHGIVNCHIHSIGAGAISLGGGNRVKLEAAGNFVENCDIHHFNRWDRSYKGAVNFDGVGNRVSHCHIHHCPALAIYLHGNDHVIEYNEIDHAMSEADEMGAVYMGRDPSERGTVIRHNFFHHIGHYEKYAKGHGSYALHFDDGCGNGTLVEGNVFWKTGSKAAFILGNEVTVRHNIIADCHYVQNPMINAYYTPHRGLHAKRLAAVNYDQPPWTERYPTFKDFFKTYPHRSNPFIGNLVINTPLVHPSRAKIHLLDMKDNRMLEQDPGLFVDAANGNFTLKPGAEIGIPGFKPIPLDRIGPKK